MDEFEKNNFLDGKLEENEIIVEHNSNVCC